MLTMRRLTCPARPVVVLFLTACTLVASGVAAAESAGADQPAAYRPGPLLQSMLDGDLNGNEEIVFAVRVSGRDHWYVNFGYYSCDYGDPAERAFGVYPDGESLRGYGDGGRLCRLNLRTGKLQVLLDDPKGGVRDPQMHYDGQKILFSYRPGDTATYHLYEINIDGTGLTQLTDGPDDDIEPAYLPDGGIIFCSSRCRRFVNCWFSRVATLYRCDGDGSQIRLVSSNNDHDNTPWILPDGRVLYMRWEYVDRSQVHFHHLWTVNPDGTGQMTFFGNMFAGTAMLDAKPIPDSNKIIASFSPGHGRPEHMGHVTIVDPALGPDDPQAARQISKGGANYRDPLAVSEDCFLVANKQSILVMNAQGEMEAVYQLPRSESHLECHEPRVLRARPRERIIPPRVDLAEETGQLFLADIYHGRNMPGVEPGEIKKLLVLEQLPMPVHFSGGMESISLGGTFTLARILGTVPVEADGSAFFEVPALRSLFFVALDENDLSVKRMQSFVTVQPGEVTGCVGCHEQRTRTFPDTKLTGLMAYGKRRPARIEPIADVPAPLDFPRDIQPILDRHCVSCHNPDRYEGRVDLCGDHQPQWSNSYYTIRSLNLVADGRNEPYGNRPPRSIGSSASRLMQLIDGSHYDARLSEHERTIVRLWIESSAAYAGTYASLGCGIYPVHLPGPELAGRCLSCHGKDGKARDVLQGRNLQALCNLDRPDKSLVLRAPLAKKAGGLGICGEGVFTDTDDADYRRILASIQAGAEQLAQGKRFDMPGFRPNRYYIREMKRFGFLPSELEPEQPVDYYATDQAYWNSFWWNVASGGAE
jgi:cytochrome c553